MGVLVSWFLDVMASWHLEFEFYCVSVFQACCFVLVSCLLSLGFKVSEFQNFQNIECFLQSIDPIYNIYASCFLEEMDPIFKILKNLLDGPSGFVGVHLVGSFPNLRFQTFAVFRNNMFENRVGFVLGIFEYLGVPKIKTNWLRESWSRRPGARTITMMGDSNFPIMSPESYWSKMEAE